jgi:KDO2-lipid IV(A) lauroyltransferase
MIASANLRTVLGRSDAGTVRRMFVHNAEYYLSLFSPRPKGFSLAGHDLHGWEHFRQALALGRGCILASPHVGDINYYAELFVASGLPVNVLVEDIQPPELSRLVAHLRARRGVHVIVGGRGALRDVYRALDRNEIVGLISDRTVDGSGEPVRFFGRCATLPDIALAIGARRKTPVIFGAAVRLETGRIVADIRPHFIPTADLPGETQRMAGTFEEFIRRWPDQWLAFQPVFGGGHG